jgi:AbrB family transcriptional regulator (stage V sporulation protein T)
MRLRDGEELEIFLENQNELVFKKYSPVKTIKSFSDEYCGILSETTGNTVIVCDKDTVVAAAGEKKSVYAGKAVTPLFEREIDVRRALIFSGSGIFSVAGEKIEDVKGQIVAPILSRGDVLGAVVMISYKSEFDESDLKLCTAAAAFLGCQA